MGLTRQQSVQWIFIWIQSLMLHLLQHHIVLQLTNYEMSFRIAAQWFY